MSKPADLGAVPKEMEPAAEVSDASGEIQSLINSTQKLTLNPQAPQEKSILDLKSSGILETEAIVVKVVKKSKLLKYDTQTKKGKFYLYLGVADETASVKLMVYGKDLHRQIKEGSSYIFRNLIKDGIYVKVNASSKVSVTKPVIVPEEFEREAERLLYPESPLTSIKDIKSSRPQTHVSVKGTVTEIDLVHKVKVEHKEKKTNQQKFNLKQEAEEISVTMWGEATKQSKDLSVGDVLLLNNMKPNEYCGKVYLNSTTFTKITKVFNAAQQPLRDIKDELEKPQEKNKEDIIRHQLIHHVTDVESVLDELFTKGVIHQESYDQICTLPTSEEKMKELLDGHLKSEEDKDILYKIVEKWIPLAQGPRLASSESVDKLSSRGYQKVVKAEMPTVVQVPEVHWITLKPEVICGDDEDTQIYSLESDAGRFECGVSGLRWVCKEKVSLKYQFGSWEEHMERVEALHFIPGGPLLNVTVIAGKLEEAYLPHWICTEDNPEVLGKFSVLHIDACGDVVEPVSEVTPSHVKLSQPHFSPIGVLVARAGFLININCKVLIFKTNMTFLTLHVYLIPSDPALQQKIKSKKLSSGFEMIEKPNPQKSLKMGNHFDLNANMDSAEITPENLKLVYEGSDPNFYEVFIENPESNFKLILTHESAPVWKCMIRKEDYTNTGDIQRMHEEKLARLSPALVQNMSSELINLLLVDLLMDGVLNDREKDSVLQENDTSADRARCLIDMVKRKGRGASRNFICHIQSRDPTLSADLGLPV